MVGLDITAPEHEVLQASLDAMTSEDRREDADRVRRAIEGYRAGGLGVAGLGPTLVALIRSQVSELLISQEFETRYAEPVPRNSPLLPAELVADLPEEVETVDLADELVTRAKRSGSSPNRSRSSPSPPSPTSLRSPTKPTNTDPHPRSRHRSFASLRMRNY